MSKYVCLCGVEFKNKEHADFHIKLKNSSPVSEDFSSQEEFRSHAIFIRTRLGDFMTGFFCSTINYFCVNLGRF